MITFTTFYAVRQVRREMSFVLKERIGYRTCWFDPKTLRFPQEFQHKSLTTALLDIGAMNTRLAVLITLAVYTSAIWLNGHRVQPEDFHSLRELETPTKRNLYRSCFM